METDPPPKTSKAGKLNVSEPPRCQYFRRLQNPRLRTGIHNNVHSLVPERGPADRFPEICEYITRANFGLAIGNFELDMHDGEIRYKTSIDVEGATITPAMVKQIVHANVIVTGLYLPGLLAVIRGELSATEAIGLAEPPG